ncbi:MAG: SsrA-binding protein SmpB [Lentisphaerae bacterium]|nr:SsrA-binding protein SmpB [Lentisphaerota bacterium]
MTAPPERSALAVNRKARRDYQVLERIEAGVALRGTEVKAVRRGGVGFAGAFAQFENGEAVLINLNIPPYEQGNRFNHEPTRPRRLLLHKKEIQRLQAQSEQKGLALVPLAVYLKRGRVKIELGLCRGKRQHDKRETLRRQDADREAARALRRR